MTLSWTKYGAGATNEYSKPSFVLTEKCCHVVVCCCRKSKQKSNHIADYIFTCIFYSTLLCVLLEFHWSLFLVTNHIHDIHAPTLTQFTNAYTSPASAYVSTCTAPYFQRLHWRTCNQSNHLFVSVVEYGGNHVLYLHTNMIEVSLSYKNWTVYPV